MPDIGLPAPDITLFFDVTPEVARQRGGYGDERYEKEEMQARVRGHFARLGEMIKDSWIVVDASRSLQEVEVSVWEHIQPMLHNVNAPIGRMWELQKS